MDSCAEWIYCFTLQSKPAQEGHCSSIKKKSRKSWIVTYQNTFSWWPWWTDRTLLLLRFFFFGNNCCWECFSVATLLNLIVHNKELGSTLSAVLDVLPNSQFSTILDVWMRTRVVFCRQAVNRPSESVGGLMEVYSGGGLGSTTQVRASAKTNTGASCSVMEPSLWEQSQCQEALAKTPPKQKQKQITVCVCVSLRETGLAEYNFDRLPWNYEKCSIYNPGKARGIPGLADFSLKWNTIFGRFQQWCIV